MSGDPKTRYCPFCGYPYQEYETTCGSCARSLPYVPPTDERSAAPPAAKALGYPPPGGDAPPARSGLPGWGLGLIGCAVLTPIFVVVVLIVAAVAIPNFISATAQAKADSANANLRAIWIAQQVHYQNTGDYLEFSITRWDQTDPNFRKLGVNLAEIHHDYDAFYDENDEFWITAVGNVDDDFFEDEWELSESTGVAEHYKNDMTDYEIPVVEEEEEEEYAEEEEEEGGVVGGIVGGQLAAKSEIELTDERAQTARENLEAIFAKQKAYKAKKKTWLAFKTGSAVQWKALGVALPNPEHHTYSATVVGGKLTLVAEGNLDGDAFLDRWTVDTVTGEAFQLKNDALNLDLSAIAGK